MKLLGKSWKYINEGNAHIVVQLVDTNYVLRLIKEDGKPVLPENIKESVNFVNSIMLPLTESYLSGSGKVVDISGSNLTELARQLQEYRPKKRLNKSLLSPIAIKVDNLCIVSSKSKTNYCVEIKPKEGFITGNLKMHSKCYYCLKQYLKVQNNDITETSAYCPLDLFSGDKERMKFALENMIRNPQNNFKLFKDGTHLYLNKLNGMELTKIVKDETLFGSTDLLINFIIEILLSEKDMKYTLKESEMECQDLPPKDSVPKLCEESNNLKPNNILYNLLELQKLSENVSYNSNKLENEHNYVPELLEQLKSMNLNLNVPKDREIFFKNAKPIHLAFISAVAKDCSIMISFSTEYVENMPYIDIEHLNNAVTTVYYKLALTDLEPKQMTTLLRRKHTEKTIIDIYEKHVQNLNGE